MERHVAFYFLHRLVDVPVQHAHRSELFHVCQCLRGIICPPTPFRINRPQRNVRENNQRRAGGFAAQIFFQPFQLFRA